MDGRRYVLDRGAPPAVQAPTLDAAQQAVVDHPGGPLLVLAGPGTGKTTTLVEAVVERVRRGLAPDQVLVLTFSRKAADELRERISGRLARTTAAPAAWTFHAFCLAVLSTYGATPVSRLLSGPERLVRIRELLRGSLAGEGTTGWPEHLRPALDTRGMAREVADLLDRARERGVDPGDLRELGRRSERPAWVAAGDFLAEFIDVLGSAGEMDYGELVRQALLLLEDPVVLADVRDRYRAVFVDEYQDTDPAQEHLLRLLAGRGGDLVAVGDPDQSIYRFRGADVACILEFPERFRCRDGTPAPVVALTVSRRAGGDLLAISRRVARRITAPGLAVDSLVAHRALQPATSDPGALEVRLFSTAAEEASAIADMLRRAHLEEGRPWSSLAVLVRSARRSLPVLRRTLVAAGVPVAAAADEIPVGRDPAVAPLLLALRCAADPGQLDEEAARILLTSPLGRMSPPELRRLGRALRAADRETRSTADSGLGLPAPSARLVRGALAVPEEMLMLDERHEVVAAPVRRLAALLRSAGRVLDAGGSVEEALWELWNGTPWPRRLLAASLAGGRDGRAADRDLDAVVALFEELARTEERRPRSGVGAVLDALEAQEIPSGSRSEGSLAAADAVRLLTAHRSKGLEWDLVVVAGVQDGSWPDVRRRASLLEADRIGPSGVEENAPSASQLLVDERRLFYVALTRARRRVVVTAVRSPEDDGDRPSRFLHELGVDVPEENAPAAALLALPSVVARLRRDVLGGDPAAAAELARLAPVATAANPDTWWGTRQWTGGVRPVRPVGEPVRLSGTAVSGYEQCPLAWFLEREVHADRPSTSAQGFGLVVHALARLVATGAVPADVPALLTRLDEVWPALGFPAAWLRDREREEARAALTRFLAWHAGRPDRELLAAETGFDVAAGEARLRGSIDRLERDTQGRVHVADLKTGRAAPANAAVAEHAQLAVYQLAVRDGGLTSLGESPVLGGAELVHLRLGTRAGEPRVQRQEPLPGPAGTWADDLVLRVARGIAGEQFPARPNDDCDRCAFRTSCPAQESGGQVVP